MNPLLAYERTITRRTFLGQSARGIGRMGLAALLFPNLVKRPRGPHFAPKARRIIYLFQSGGPSHVDLFDYKPRQLDLHATELPSSVRGDQRVTGMTVNQASFPVVAPNWPMRRCGKHGTWISDLLPHTQTIADDICIVKSMVTEAINHDPAITFINTGSQQIRPCQPGSLAQLRARQRKRESAWHTSCSFHRAQAKIQGSQSLHDFGAAGTCLAGIRASC